MNGVEKQILDLIKSLHGKSADKITNAISNIGNGNMVDGLERLANYIKKSTLNLKKGRVQGAVAVGIITLPLLITIIIIILKDKYKKDKKHKEEGEAILKGLEEELSDTTNN